MEKTTITVNVVAPSLDEVLQKANDLNVALKNAKSLAGDLANMIGGLSTEVDIQR